MKAFTNTAAALSFALALSMVQPAGAWEEKQYDVSKLRENDVAYKIHGDNGGDAKYKCHSFETEMPDRSAAVLHAKLATYAYQDGNLGYRYTASDGTAVELTREQALHETGYTQLDGQAVRRYIPEGTDGLHVDKDGNITGKSADGLNAVLLQGPRGEIVISYRGTNPNAQDIVDDAKQAAVAKIVPQQYKDAALLLQTVMDSTGKETQIVCDGHSLGGGEVTYAMAATDLQNRVTGYTYNAAGLSESTLESLDENRVLDAAHNIVNVRNQWDPVSYVGYHLGPTYEVKTTGPYQGDNHNPKNDHSIAHLTENMIAAVGPSVAPKTVPPKGNGTDGAKTDGRVNDGMQDNAGRHGADTSDSVNKGRQGGVENTVQSIVDLIREATGWTLDEKTTGNIIDVIIEAIKDGGTKLYQYEQKIGDMLPGDSSKAALGTLLGKIVGGDTSGIETAIRDFGQSVAVDYATGLVVDMGLVEGMAVMDIQKTLQSLISGGYDTGVSFSQILNDGIKGGCFGNNTGAPANGGIVSPPNGANVPTTPGGIAGITPAGVWGTIKAKIQTIALPKLEQFAVKQLDKWIAKNPTVKKWLTEIFGVDGRSIVNGLKNIWGVLTSNGTLAEKFSKLVEMAQNALCDMAKHALQWGLGKLQSWLSNIANKLISKVLNWLANKLQHFLGKFGITIPQNLINKVQAWLQAQVGRGVQKVVDVLDQAGTSIIDQFRPKSSQGSSGGQLPAWSNGQQQPQPQTP